MASISGALQRIKHNPLGVLSRAMVERACREKRHCWRERELDPATTVALFLQQIIHGNTPCSEVRHIAGRSFTPQAYCDARMRLPLAVLHTLFHEVYRLVVPHTWQDLWHGHRTFHIDGSTFSMSDTPELRKAFGKANGTGT